ncbi:lipase family protein [Gordonia sp. ABSL11-1]|uniref:lipase family protein n=1 Tax=Gordonia sp. ABSL11-1 TaxID=3053924 RepID=UPI002572E917|nr:lipase family protein [Gordonia sp. ABSL11-1]MDL9948719.1 lipase family protein [Gordonia sp. ABSL11-1]
MARSEDAPEAWTARVPDGTRITRITYHSTSGVDGSPTSVTGAVFVPDGDRPSAGWPLIAYAHGTTGITRDCAPSDNPTMFGDLAAVRGFLRDGYAVVTTDYQGLGVRANEPAPHPYLEPRTAAFNIIDSVRAARSIEPTIGSRWVAVGASQGGAAAWSAAEEYSTYGSGGGVLVGAVAAAPLLDPAFLVERAQQGSLTIAQRYLYPLVVEGVAKSDPHIRPLDHLHGVAAASSARLVSCSGNKGALSRAMSTADASSFVSVSPQAASQLTTALQRFTLPRTATDVPILAVYGSDDDVIPVDVMEVTLGRACALGDRVLRVRREGQGHSLDPGAIMGTWMRDRIDGHSATGDC